MVVISDLFDMFFRDPQIEANEARYLTNEIVKSITKSKALEDLLVVVSLPFCNSPSIPGISYNKMVLTRFDKSMEITDKENNMIDLKISNNNKKTKNATNGVHNDKLLSINKRDLLRVSAPKK